MFFIEAPCNLGQADHLKYEWKLSNALPDMSFNRKAVPSGLFLRACRNFTIISVDDDGVAVFNT
jgi:hypothetical protein